MPDTVPLMKTVIGIIDIQVQFPLGAFRAIGLHERGEFGDRDKVAIDIEGWEGNSVRRLLIRRTAVSPHEDRSARNRHHAS